MTELSDILTLNEKDGMFLLTIDTTRSNFMGCERNPLLGNEIANWDTYKPFADQYGLVLSLYVEDFVSIFVLSQLLQDFKIFCHPDEQDENSSLNRLNLDTNLVKWIYKTCIYHDQEYNYTVEFEEFKDSGYFPPFKWSDFEKTVKGNLLARMWNKARFIYEQSKARVSQSKMYRLTHSSHIYQAVICGGNSDVYKCPNYLGFETEAQGYNIVALLADKKKPSLHDVLNYASFFAIDFKGEDMGYARQLKIYSKLNFAELVSKLEDNFNSFLEEFKRINIESESLDQFEAKMNKLIRKYGR